MALLRIEKRDKLGTRHSRRLRQQGRVPGIVYGHGQENQPISLASHDIEAAVQHGEHLLKADLDGNEENFLIKDVQYDYLGQHVLHVDLTRVRLDERVEVTVPIVLRGTPVGVDADNGVLTQPLSEATIECLVTDIPEELRVSVTELGVGQSLRVADLELPSGVVVKEEPETVVASVTVVAEEEVAPAEEEAAPEPEIIGEEAEEQAPPESEEESK